MRIVIGSEIIQRVIAGYGVCGIGSECIRFLSFSG